jgi:signal transduction histidine kinase/ActR/RegA family two-component response regulator
MFLMAFLFTRRGGGLPMVHDQRPPESTPGRVAPAQVEGTKTAILNALPAHIARLDRAGTIAAVNESWKRLRLGGPQGRPAGVGDNYLLLCEQAHGHFGDKARLVARGVSAVLAGLIAEFFLEYPCQSGGREQWYRLIATPMHGGGRPADQPGRVPPDGAVVMHLNISSHKQTEQQLVQSRKMEAIGQLAGGVAHDFNNLLCVMNGYADFLLGQLPPGGPLYEYADEIRKAGERASALTRQLLAFSRRQMLQVRVVDLNTLVRDAEMMLRRLIGEDVEVVTALDPALRPVLADPGQVEQILLNLAVNARDAMPQGGRLLLSTANAQLDSGNLPGRPEVRPGRYALLSVSDSGCGMTSEVLAHLFEPFFTTKPAGKGTGLGLATVYGIVKQLGGHVEVDSEPGRGSTFRVYLPHAESTAPSLERGPRPAEVRGGGETILLAEDESGVRSLACRVLQQKGYTVLEASDGEQALSLCQSYPGRIDLLLTDAIMPKLSGVALARRVTALRPGIRMMFMSGFTDSALVRHGMATGEVECLLKPFTPEALARVVRQVLDNTGRPAMTCSSAD